MGNASPVAPSPGGSGGACGVKTPCSALQALKVHVDGASLSLLHC